MGQDRELLDFVRSGPPAGHLPLVLLAAVHYLILGSAGGPLADIYAGRSDGDPGPAFLEFCRSHRDELRPLLDVRHTQTNDCGRSAIIGPGLTWLSSELGRPLAMIDVGPAPA